MRKIYPVILFIIFTATVNAQYKISGNISSINGKNINGATISINSKFYKYQTQSGKDGKFQFKNLDSGLYSIVVSHVTFKKIRPIQIQVNENIVGINIILSDSIYKSQTVTVNSRANFLTIKGDKLIYNPSFLPGVNSDNSYEILKKIPGFWIEPDNGIHVSGSNNISILIDGVKQNLIGNQIATILQSIPASDLDRVEVITGGSYLYEGSSGTIVDIRLKKRKVNGINLSVTNGVSFNKYVSDNHSVYLAFRSKNVTTNSSIGYTNNYTYSDKEGSSLFGQDNSIKYNSFGKVRSQTPSIYHNMVWNISNKSSLLFNGSGTWKRSKNELIDTSHFITGNNYNQIYNNTNDKKNMILNMNLMYKLKLDTSNSYLSGGYDYLYGFIHQNQYFANTLQYDSPSGHDGSVFMKAINPLDGRQHIFNLDFHKVFKNKVVLNLGGKYTIGKLTNKSLYDTIFNNEIKYDSSRSVDSKYNENISSTYLGLQYQKGKIGFVGGLRMEHTNTKSGIKDNLSYTNWLPNITINYNVPNFALLLKLSTTINRPDYQYLNTSQVYLSDYKYLQGNLSIRPSTQHRISLENSLFDFLNISIGYIRIDDQILVVGSQQAASPNIILIPINAVNVNDFYANISLYYSLITSKLEGQISAYGEKYHYIIPNGFSNQNITGNPEYGTISWTNNYKISKKITVETSAFIRSNAEFYQIYQKHRWQADLGLNYSPNNKWNIALKYYDIFKTYKFAYFNYFDGYTDHYKTNPHVNKLRFTVTYRFNSIKKKIEKLKSNSNSENATRFND